jgi:methyl-accepting chemotaxis protein
MRSSLKQQITLMVIAGIVLLTVCLMFAFYFQARSTALLAAETKAKSDLATAAAIIDLKFPGPWMAKDGILYKGQVKMNDNFAIVDYIKELTGDSCTVFLNNVRVATTVRLETGARAVGTHAAQEVTDTVLGARQEYVGEAQVVGRINQTAYAPIADDNGEVIGMLYVGASRSFYDAILYGSLKVMGLASLILTALAGVATWYLISRSVVGPIQEVIRGTRQVALTTVSNPLPVQSNNEIGDLVQAFNQMLVKMQALTGRFPDVNEVPPARERIGPGEEPDSEFVDVTLTPQAELPKGLNRVTLRQVVEFMKQKEGEDVTIQDVSEAINISKVTVRRYFDFLEQDGLVSVIQKYGSVGRPLRIYRLKQ